MSFTELDTMSTGVLINTADFRCELLIIYHADRVESTGTTHQTEEESGSADVAVWVFAFGIFTRWRPAMTTKDACAK